MRRATALVVAAGLLAVTLTGCSSDPNANCDTALKPGTASNLITATGKLGSKPKVSFPTPIDTKTSQSTTLIDGSGEQVRKGQMVEIQYTLLDGETGATGSASSYSKSEPTLIPVGATNIPGINDGLQCATVGSRIAIAIAPKDSGSDGATSSVVAVIDLVGAFLPKADGAVRPSVSGFPTVVLAPTGQPGITIPSGSAPTAVRSETLKAGDGATVKKDSTVVLHYTAVGWDAKNVVFSTWQNGAPDLVAMASGQSSANQALPQAMLKELVGQKVGSQVVVETPKDSSIPAAAWVVDILGVR
ncbi:MULTISPECIES: FKBP-type peptidyl-prolyl cis-trans isomerase [unclassified Leifsonia]|uniref:FKBP-type peptidyl-prolyl cis-trans isomerase n=1 Tax=unclassified Leifsonia TaxID=2663824 RepID=UPI000A18E4D7|nr:MULTISPECIES: peptidylprolyl isomerase [unclassified Leifsonia]QIZ98815.1 peptidylprolyl isomerase [Leifsonia sp. PS1209]